MLGHSCALYIEHPRGRMFHTRVYFVCIIQLFPLRTPTHVLRSAPLLFVTAHVTLLLLVATTTGGSGFRKPLCGVSVVSFTSGVRHFGHD